MVLVVSQTGDYISHMSNSKAQDLGHRVRSLVVERGTSIKWLAGSTTIDYKTLLKRVEQPELFTLRDVAEIAAAFKVDADWLQTGVRVEVAA